MKVKLTYSLRDMYVSRETDLPARYDGLDGTEFVLWMREIEHQGRLVRQLCCDVMCDVDPPKRAKDTLLALSENRLLLDDPIQEGLPQTAISEGTIVDLQGNIKPNWIVDFDLLPEGAKPWFRQINTELAGRLSNFIKLLRWSQNTAGGHLPFSWVGSYWSLGGAEWSPLPLAASVKISQPRAIKASNIARAKITAILNNHDQEPISHDLIREAGELVYIAPRSALLVAFAALETGIKQQIKRMVPDASVLIDEMPSPSLLKLFHEIFPSIIKMKGMSSDYFPLNNAAKGYLQKWISQRNQVTHGTKHKVKPDDVADFILFSKDILYLIDHVSGYAWALDHLESSFWATKPNHD